MFAAAILRAQLPRYGGEEQRLLQLGLILSVVFSVLHVWVVRHVLGGGDMMWYHSAGNKLATLWQSEPSRWTSELMKLTFRQSAEFPFWIHGAGGGSSTGAMFGVSTWIMLLNGKSLYAACAFLSILNFFARVLIYRVFRPLVVPAHRRFVLMGIVLLPSTIFWTAGVIKESVAMTGMGLAVLGAYHLAERADFVRGLAWIALGGLTAYLVKPYVLFPFFVAAPLWYLAARMREDGQSVAMLMTPMRLIVFGALLAAGLIGLAYLVPSLGVESLGDELASVQSAGTTVAGATNYQLVSAETVATRGRTAQLVMAPFAFLFALTRPWPFEARSGQTLVAMVEITALTLFLLRSIRHLGWMRWIRHILVRPWLVFCVAYVVIFGTAVGLGSTNVGSLSRYRVPMMMFYGALVAMSYGWAYVPVALTQDDTSNAVRGSALRWPNGRRKPLAIQYAVGRETLALRQEVPRNMAAERRAKRPQYGPGHGGRRTPFALRRGQKRTKQVRSAPLRARRYRTDNF